MLSRLKRLSRRRLRGPRAAPWGACYAASWWGRRTGRSLRCGAVVVLNFLLSSPALQPAVSGQEDLILRSPHQMKAQAALSYSCRVPEMHTLIWIRIEFSPWTRRVLALIASWTLTFLSDSGVENDQLDLAVLTLSCRDITTLDSEYDQRVMNHV